MGYLEGFGVTIKKWFGVNTDSGRRVTMQYPEQTRPKPERFHGRHVLNRYDDGMEKCIGCELCAGVCPAKCIYVRGQDNDPEDPTSPGERFGFVYEINYLRCIHCDLCVEACPTEAITETKMFEFAFTNRSDAIYTKDELLVGDDGRPQQLPWENWEGGFDAAADSSGWMRATAPSGDADFVGIVAWAGELGYGVRPPENLVVDEPADGHDDHDHGHHDDHGHGDHDDHGQGDHGDHGHDDPALPVAPPDLLDVPEPSEERAAAAAAFDAETPDAETAADVPESLTAAEAKPLLVDAVEPDTTEAPATDDSATEAAAADESATDEGATDEGATDDGATDDGSTGETSSAGETSTAGFFDAPEAPVDESKGRRRFGRKKGDRP